MRFICKSCGVLEYAKYANIKKIVLGVLGEWIEVEEKIFQCPKCGNDVEVME